MNMVDNRKRNVSDLLKRAGSARKADEYMKEVPEKPMARSSLEEQIDANLRRAYQSTLDDPIPDRFLTLIAELRSKLAQTSGETGEKAPGE
jgi:hypothetical protein